MLCDANYLEVEAEVEAEVEEEEEEHQEREHQEEDPQDHLTLTPPNNQPNKPKMSR